MKRIELFFIAALLPLDFLMLIAASVAAYSIRFSPIFAKIRPITFDLPFPQFLGIALPMSLLLLFTFAVSGLYAIRQRRIAIEIIRVILAVTAGIGVSFAIAFFSRELFDSRFIVLGFWAFAILFVVLERLTIRKIQKQLRKKGIGLRNIIIIGQTKQAHALKQFFKRYPQFGYRIKGQVAHFNAAAKEKILSLKHRDLVDGILVANPDLSRAEVEEIKTFSDIEHVEFIYSADMFPGSTTRPIFHTFAGQPIIEVPKTPLHGWGSIYKRGFDIVIALALIFFSLPLQLLAATLIKLETKGPILFFQRRVGQSGKEFPYFKFRSMHVDAENLHFDEEFLTKNDNIRKGPLVKIINDPRVTRVGNIIRKFSIDEVPEFYNVLLGNMSLVGPRPHMPGEVEQYKPSQRRVLTIKPGITGMAQISGRGQLDHEKEVYLDMHYIENWSPLLDLIILLKTPLVLFERLDDSE